MDAAMLTRLSFFSRVELSTGVQRCLCCIQQREAEMFSGLGHSVYSVKPSVKKVILEEENASLASVEAMLTQKTLEQHANNIPGMQTLANLYHLYHWITINTTKQTCMNAQMYVNICILRVSFRQRDRQK